MRGTDVTQDSMFSDLTLEDYVPKEHSLRPIRELFSRVLDQAKAKGLLSSERFSVVDTRLTQANGTAEREAAIEMLAELPGKARKTVGADKTYDSDAFVEGCRKTNVTPHAAQNTSGRASRIDERTTRHPGYRISQFARKLIETVFGDAKQRGILRQVKLRGLPKVELLFTLVATVVNLRRLPKLLVPESSG